MKAELFLAHVAAPIWSLKPGGLSLEGFCSNAVMILNTFPR
jgi:hypothetical protein